VGDDIFGPMTRENLRQQGIDVRYVLSEQNTSSGVAPILVDESGRNLVVAVPGANSMLGSKDVREAEEAICKAKIVISQLEIPDEAIAEAFSIARSANVNTILNPAPARKVEANIIKMADWIVPNETEAELLTGIHVDSLDRAIQLSIRPAPATRSSVGSPIR
jgi:ribokinase